MPGGRGSSAKPSAELSPSSDGAWSKLQGTVCSQLTVDFERNGQIKKLPIAALQSLGQHVTKAREANLPIRMIVITEKPSTDEKTTREIHVRTDLIGKVTSFDGERFVIDFVRVVGEPARGSAR